MDLGIVGKVALVVGASRSIGRACAVELAREGCKVVALARSQPELSTLKDEIGCTIHAGDLMDQAQLAAAVTRMADEVGPPEIVVHAIGGSMGLTGAFLPSSDWAKVWRLNLGISHDINREFIPAMVMRRWGRIVHFSSIGTTLNIGYCPYTSAKHAVNGYVKNVSKEVSAKGVIISAVSPGPIFTEGRYLYTRPEDETQRYLDAYVPMQRWGRAEEVARTVAFLCSKHSSYMAGAIVAVDGGAR